MSPTARVEEDSSVVASFAAVWIYLSLRSGGTAAHCSKPHPWVAICLGVRIISLPRRNVKQAVDFGSFSPTPTPDLERGRLSGNSPHEGADWL